MDHVRRQERQLKKLEVLVERLNEGLKDFAEWADEEPLEHLSAAGWELEADLTLGDLRFIKLILDGAGREELKGELIRARERAAAREEAAA